MNQETICKSCEGEADFVRYRKNLQASWCDECYVEFYLMPIAETMDQDETYENLRYKGMI